MDGERFTTTTFLVAVAGVLSGALLSLLVAWAVVHGRLGEVGLAAVFFFLAYSGLGFVYAWWRGGPDWETTEPPDRDVSAGH